jgi:hypothetical protein
MDNLMTFGIALILTVFVQCALVGLWRHVLNARFYRWHQGIDQKLERSRCPSWVICFVPVCFWSVAADYLWKKRTVKPPTFRPYPKSLMWPTPLFFTTAVFITGLTRASVKILAAQPSGCNQVCTGTAVVTLVLIAFLLVLLLSDLMLLFYSHGEHVSWKLGGKVQQAEQVVDPMMRLHASVRVQLTGLSIFTRQAFRARRTVRKVMPFEDPVGPDSISPFTELNDLATISIVKDGGPLPMSISLAATSGGGEWTIGREHHSDVLIPDLSVSRRHARIFSRENVRTMSSEYYLQDLGSRHGSHIGGVRLGQEPVRLQDGLRIMIGASGYELVPKNVMALVEKVAYQKEQREHGAPIDPEVGECSPLSPKPSRRQRRLQQRTMISLRQAKIAAIDMLGDRGGYHDRKSGSFAVTAPEDAAEPERTERILANPFIFCRRRPGDAFQQREGYLLFRVNGSSRLGVSYRVIVLCINVLFGVISGMQPLISPGTAAAHLQTSLVLALQMAMGLLCFCILPDADRVVSRIAGSQFFAEGISTAALLGASFAPATDGAEAGLSTESEEVPMISTRELLRNFGFLAAITAMAMPIFQLLEQRCITPSILLLRNKTGDKLALGAAFYLLITALPRQIMRLRDALATAASMNVEDAAGGASADAGDDEGGGGGNQGEGEEKRGGADKFKAGTGATKLLARAAGAKELSQKQQVSPMKNGPGREAEAGADKTASNKEPEGRSGENGMFAEDIEDGDE